MDLSSSGSDLLLEDGLGEGERLCIDSGNVPGRDRLDFLSFSTRVFGADWIPRALGRGNGDVTGVLGLGMGDEFVRTADGDNRLRGSIEPSRVISGGESWKVDGPA